MLKKIVVCDGCGKKQDAGSERDFYAPDPGWRVLLQESCEILHFCSIHCIGIYLDAFFKIHSIDGDKP